MENLELFYSAIDFMSDLFDEDYMPLVHIPEDVPDNYKAIFVLNRPNIDPALLEDMDQAYDNPQLKEIKPPEDKEQIDAWLKEQPPSYKFFVYMGMLSAATLDGLGFYEQKDISSLPDEYKNVKCYLVIYDKNWEASLEDFQEFEDASFNEEETNAE